MIRLYTYAVLFAWFVIYALSPQAQHSSPSTTPENTQDDLATIYIYRLDTGNVFTSLFLRTSPVYFGKGQDPKNKLQKIAALHNKHYLMMRLSPGQYTFNTRLSAGRLNLHVRAGKEYYLHLDRGNDCPDRKFDDFSMPPCESRSASIEYVFYGQWRDDSLGLRPIKPKDIQDKNLVIIPPTKSAKIHSNRARPVNALLDA